MNRCSIQPTGSSLDQTDSHRPCRAHDSSVRRVSGTWTPCQVALELPPFSATSCEAFGALTREDVMVESGQHRNRWQLSPEEKWEIFLEMTSKPDQLSSPRLVPPICGC